MVGPIKFAPGLYCGSRPETPEDLAALKDFVLIDLERHPLPGHTDLWFPLRSIIPPLLFRVAAVINALNGRVRNKKYFLHCRTCRDRTPYVVAKYLIVSGKSRSEALEFIEQFKPHLWLAWHRWFI